MCEHPEDCRYFQALQAACATQSQERAMRTQEKDALLDEIDAMKDFANRLYAQGRKMRQAQRLKASGASAEEKAFDDLLADIKAEAQKRKAMKEAAK